MRAFFPISSISLLTALLLAAPARSQEQWYTYYTNAQEAIAASDWSRAVQELEKALQRKPAPQFEAETYALQLVNYVPFYWLGVAYYNQGDFEKADANFAKSLSWGTVNKTGYYQTLLSYQGTLRRIQTARDSLTSLRRANRESPGAADRAALLAARWDALADALGQDDIPRARGILREIRTLSPESGGNAIIERLLQQLAESRREAAENRSTAAADRLMDEGLAQFLSGNYRAAYRSFAEAARSAPQHRGVDGWLRRTELEIQQAGIALPEPLPPDTVRMTVAPVVLFSSESPETRDDSVWVSGSLGDDQGIDYYEFTLNGEVYRDAQGNPLLRRPPSPAQRTQFQFRERMPLQLGENRIIITAYDVDAVRHSASFPLTVRRNPPFYRTPLFYYSSATLLVLLAGGLAANLLIKRRIAFVNRYNPYIAGAPVRNPRMFFGREALLQKIINTLHNNSLMIYGPRRIGKTSLLHQLKQKLEQTPDREYFFVPVYIDLQGTPESRFFAVMMHDIVDGCESHIRLPEDLRIKAGDGDYSARDFSADIKQILALLKPRSSKRLKLVLLIDEVDELNAYSERANQKLRSIFMKTFAESLVAVMSGSFIRKHWESEGSPWYNFFEEIPLDSISRQDGEALIRQPVKGIFRYEDGAVDKILEYSENVPYRIQKFCVNLVANAIEARRRVITAEDVERARANVLESEDV